MKIYLARERPGTQKTITDHESMSRKFRIIFIPSIFLLILCSFPTHASAASHYAIIDAGSSGSRLFLYKTGLDAQGNLTATSIPMVNNNVSPGISTLVAQPAEVVGAYIEPLLILLDDTMKVLGIPQSDVNFSLIATAGMRVESPLLQQRVYEAVQAEAKAMLPSMNIQYTLTLQGRYEGAFQWLCVNYLKGNLTPQAGTVGVLESGGGSFQLAYETGSKASNTIDLLSLRYGPTAYKLFSRSYTGLGGNYSREDATDDPSSFPVGYPLASGAVGSGDYKQGLISTRKLIRARPTAIPGSAKVPPLEKFVGVGLFKSVADDLGLGDSISANRVDQAASIIAATPWATQLAQSPNNPFLFSKVDSAQLVSELIRTWFPAGRELAVARKIGGTNINWTLGAVLFLASDNELPASQ